MTYFITCPIAIPYHGTDYKITRVTSVCLSALIQLQLLFDFDETLRSGSEPEK